MLRCQHSLPLAFAWVFAVVAAHAQSPSVAAGLLPQDQRFVCNDGYTRETCHLQVQLLAAHLARFHNALPPDWTWVLVRAEDWQSILLRLNRDPQSPAFSVLDQRRTFLSEALFACDALSGGELLRTYKIPLDRILDVAITHELGHAYCGDRREVQAERFAERLRNTSAASCAVPDRSPRRDTVSTMPSPK